MEKRGKALVHPQSPATVPGREIQNSREFARREPPNGREGAGSELIAHRAVARVACAPSR